MSATDHVVGASSISEAELVMGQETYEAVLDAKKVDADVSGLLVRLNDAATQLSEANIAFEAGDFEEAARFAESTSEVARASKNSGFYFQLFFELWLHDSEGPNFQFHDRFVGIWLNITVQTRVLRSTVREFSLDDFDRALVDVIGNQHPETLEEVVKLARLRFSESEEAIMERVIRLESAHALFFGFAFLFTVAIRVLQLISAG